MATTNPANPVGTVRSLFWNDSYAPISGRVPGLRRTIQRIMRRRSMQVDAELDGDLRGASVGANTSLRQYVRREKNDTSTAVTSVGALGGAVAYETVTQVNRVTATADKTQLDNLMAGTSATKPAPVTYPGDLGGNGK